MKGLILAMLVAYAGWWLWQGPPKKKPATTVPPRAPTSLQTVEQNAAFAVLGLDPGADDEQIRAAHRRLMLAVHPDRGGSADLTRRVNAARDLLLKRPGATSTI